jgi:hypothetical protein
MPRIRHCVECPNCHTRYLIAFSPYRNGAYLLPAVDGCWDDYTLYCGCQNGWVVSRWKWREAKPCEVSKAAYERGYGTPDEILTIDRQREDEWTFDASRYLANWQAIEKRKGSS